MRTLIYIGSFCSIASLFLFAIGFLLFWMSNGKGVTDMMYFGVIIWGVSAILAVVSILLWMPLMYLFRR